jgi:hypothetical protein
MANLTQTWIAWLRSLGINPEADAMLQVLIRHGRQYDPRVLRP